MKWRTQMGMRVAADKCHATGRFLVPPPISLSTGLPLSCLIQLGAQKEP